MGLGRRVFAEKQLVLEGDSAIGTKADYRAYMDDMTDTADWWRSNAVIPEMFDSIETVLPRLILGMFSKPEWFDVTCPHYTLPAARSRTC